MGDEAVEEESVQAVESGMSTGGMFREEQAVGSCMSTGGMFGAEGVEDMALMSRVGVAESGMSTGGMFGGERAEAVAMSSSFSPRLAKCKSDISQLQSFELNTGIQIDMYNEVNDQITRRLDDLASAVDQLTSNTMGGDRISKTESFHDP